MKKFFALFVLALVASCKLQGFNLFLRFQGAPKEAYKGLRVKWTKINPGGVAVFYAGRTTYSDQDGKAMITVPMPTLKNFDLVLGKNIKPMPMIDKTIDHIAIDKGSVKTSVLYTFSCQEIEVSEQAELSSGIEDKDHKAKEGEGGEKKEAQDKKIKKLLWSIEKGIIPETGKLKNNTVIIMIDSDDVVVPMEKFQTPASNPNIFLPTFFLVERDKDVDMNILQSFSKQKSTEIPVAAAHSLELVSTKEAPGKGVKVETSQLVESSFE